MTTTVTSTASADTYAALNASAAPATTKNEAGSAERFLKLLVTQMQNQDPLNPMDNAQITSQMAQINTVNGVEALNTTVEGLSGQFMQMQALQGASLVGHDVTLKGNRLAVEGGSGSGGFELSGKADKVKVEVLSSAGRLLGTLDLGPMDAGRHGFAWPGNSGAAALADGADVRFKVTATSGNSAVSSTPLMRDRVQSVSSSSGGLVLQTAITGDVAYRDVKAFN